MITKKATKSKSSTTIKKKNATKKKFSIGIDKKIRKKDQLLKVCKVFDRTEESVNHFFEIYTELGRGKTGAPSHSRQDLLRAMLVFASAGIDIFLKQIIKNSLPAVIETDNGAQTMFIQFIERRLKKTRESDKIVSIQENTQVDIKFIAGAIGSNDTRNYLLKEYEKDLVNSSLQSRDEIFRVAAAFAITSEKILGKIKADSLKDVFLARNDVIHEMDIDFNKTVASDTKKRKQDETVKQCKIIFEIMNNFLKEVSLKLENDKK